MGLKNVIFDATTGTIIEKINFGKPPSTVYSGAFPETAWLAAEDSWQPGNHFSYHRNTQNIHQIKIVRSFLCWF